MFKYVSYISLGTWSLLSFFSSITAAKKFFMEKVADFNRQFFKTPTNPIYSCPTACSHCMPTGPCTNQLPLTIDPTTTPETTHMINSPCRGTSFLTWTSLVSRLVTPTETACCLWWRHSKRHPTVPVLSPRWTLSFGQDVKLSIRHIHLDARLTIPT